MNLNYFYVIPIVWLLFSCSSDDNLGEESLLKTPEVIAVNGDFEIAVAKLKNSFNIIKAGGITTKSSQSQSLNNIKILNYQRRSYSVDINKNKAITKTKSILSGLNENVRDSVSVYLIEFENNGTKGFSVASGDYRLPHAIAISEQGSLSDTVSNVGLSMYINSLGEICKEQITKYEIEKNAPTKNTRLAGVYSPIKPEILSYVQYKQYYGDDAMDEVEAKVTEGYVTKDINPLLKTQWSQNAPYNYKCNNGNAPAGCVPIATAQIMAYFKKPYTIAYWDELTKDSYIWPNDSKLSDRVSTLLYDVGKGVKVSYSSDGSGADFKDAAPYLRSVGINCTFLDYMDNNVIINQLNASKPVMLAGKKTNAFLGLWYKDGHAWIIDGHFSFRYYCTMSVIKYILDDSATNWVEWGRDDVSYWSDATYYHINWGWGGNSDGYYTTVNYAYNNKDYYKYDKRMIVF
ncbi:MAG: C10 family peptidase [Bacteroides sp.]